MKSDDSELLLVFRVWNRKRSKALRNSALSSTTILGLVERRADETCVCVKAATHIVMAGLPELVGTSPDKSALRVERGCSADVEPGTS